MARWQPDSAVRLTEAALALFSERGFDEVTVAEIAERAGVTERTFFRHFADKREVLFAGGTVLREVMVEAATSAPVEATPLDAVASALEAMADVLERRREFARARHVVVSANPELRERELIKLASLGDALAETLRARGVPEPAASLTAQAGIAVFHVAFDRWAIERTRDLATLIQESLNDLRALAA